MARIRRNTRTHRMKRLETDGFRFRWTSGQPSRGEYRRIRWLATLRKDEAARHNHVHRCCCNRFLPILAFSLGPPTPGCLFSRQRCTTYRLYTGANLNVVAVYPGSFQIRHVQDAPISVDTCAPRQPWNVSNAILSLLIPGLVTVAPFYVRGVSRKPNWSTA